MKLARRRFLYFATSAAAFPAFPRTAGAQVFPTRAMRLIVPLSAGSAADILARLLATKMSESWGQPVVVENRSGAGTTIGTNAVAKAAPDGHTLLVNSAAFAASAAIYAKLTYDPLKDFAPVSQLAIAPIVVVAAPSLGVGSIKELIELAKRKPGQLKFGSSGVGSSTHFAGEQFKLAAGLSVVHVAYKGSPEAALDTMTGRIEYCLSPVLPALPFIRDGKLLALAVTTAQRSPLLQDVPTVAEAGVPNYEYQDWWGVFAPTATPVVVIDKIERRSRAFSNSQMLSNRRSIRARRQDRARPPTSPPSFVLRSRRHARRLHPPTFGLIEKDRPASSHASTSTDIGARLDPSHGTELGGWELEEYSSRTQTMPQD